MNKDMKILTQEEFDKCVKESEYASYVIFSDYIVRDITISEYHINKEFIEFTNCRIEELHIDDTVLDEDLDDLDYFFNMLVLDRIIFNVCEIVDPSKIMENTVNFECHGCTCLGLLPLVCPAEGEFVGYKKCKYYDTNDKYTYTCIVKLLIPADAERSSGFGRKCRCSKAKVLGIYGRYDVELKDVVAYSMFDDKTSYKVGEWVYPDYFDEDRYNECSNGIHFFMTFEEAKYY